MKINASLGRSFHGRRTLRSLAAVSVVGLTVGVPLWSCRWLGPGAAIARADEPKAAPQDDDDAEYERQVARLALRDNCLICHSVEMVEGQRLTRAQWKAEVEKMVGLGSPLPPDRVEPLINYLAEQFTDTTPPATPARMTYEQALELVKPDPPGALPAGAEADRGATLYAANCATCHGPTGQGADLGPNLVEVVVVERQADFREVVRNGRHRMPGFINVLKPEQEADILAWLRTRRYQAPPAK